MYEEITTLIVQVYYFTLIFTFKQLSTFIFNKYEFSIKITQLSSMHYYNINKLNVISNRRTRRKTLSWKPVEPVRPSLTRINHHTHHTPTLPHPTQTPNHLCTTVQRNIPMFNTFTNLLPLHNSSTSFKEPSSTYTTVNILSSIPTKFNHLLKSYTNLSTMPNKSNIIYAKDSVFKNIINLSTFKCPNCRIQRRSSPNNTSEPSSSLHPPLTFPLPQVAKINSHRRLCLKSPIPPFIYVIQRSYLNSTPFCIHLRHHPTT